MKSLSLSSLTSLRRNESGSTAVEFAFIGSILIFMTIGTFELGRLAYAYYKLTSVTARATRMVGMGAFDETIVDTIKSNFAPGEGTITVSIRSEPIGPLSYKRIEAQFILPLIIPGFGLFSETSENSITLRTVELVPID